jgi:hypothetical protein
MKKWNHYHCPMCGGVTIARHDDEGVTPFLLRGRAKDRVFASGVRVQGCHGMAQSSFFTESQADDQVPHVIFYRPAAIEAIAAINLEQKQHRAAMLEHYQNGGSLMREA